MDPFIGEIRLFPFSKIPIGWLPCNGQLLSASDYPALFNLLGNTYGGTATTFALPDLQGRVMVGQGTSTASGVNYAPGNAGGVEQVALNDETFLPAHNHMVNVNTSYDQGGASNGYPGNPNIPTSSTQAAKNTANVNLYNPAYSLNTIFPVNMVTANGGGEPHENRMPFVAMNYCIANRGVYPPNQNS